MKFKEIAQFLLILLFSYAAFSKLADFSEFRREMLNQVFSPGLDQVLVWLVPALELFAVALLLLPATLKVGLWLSLALMTAFSTYISLVILHFWKRVPCSCGGILGRLSWRPHLVFNLIFLLITIIAIVELYKERRAGDP